MIFQLIIPFTPLSAREEWPWAEKVSFIPVLPPSSLHNFDDRGCKACLLCPFHCQRNLGLRHIHVTMKGKTSLIIAFIQIVCIIRPTLFRTTQFLLYVIISSYMSMTLVFSISHYRVLHNISYIVMVIRIRSTTFT